MYYLKKICNKRAPVRSLVPHMQSSAKSSSDAEDFSEDLKRIKTRIQCETHTFDDMPADGKRKCIDDLEHTIQTLQKIKNDLKEAENSSPDRNLLQIL